MEIPEPIGVLQNLSSLLKLFGGKLIELEMACFGYCHTTFFTCLYMNYLWSVF